MFTVTLPKNVEDISEPVPLPEGWYTLQIIDEPEMAANRAMSDRGPGDVDARTNIVIKCAVVSDDENINGRPFILYLSMPNANDATRRTKLGQTYEDLFSVRIADYAEAFGGSRPVGDEVGFSVGQRALFYIVQELGQDGSTIRNSVSFNTKPRICS